MENAMSVIFFNLAVIFHEFQECHDRSDERNCSNETHFYCDDEGPTLFVPISQVCMDRDTQMYYSMLTGLLPRGDIMFNSFLTDVHPYI